MKVYGTVNAQVLYCGNLSNIGTRVWVELDDPYSRPTDEAMTEAIASHLTNYQMTLVQIDGWTRASDFRMGGY